MGKFPLTPVRARRELHHLYRLRERHTARERVAAAKRAVVGFSLAFIATAKAIFVKSLAAKLAFAAAVGIFVAYPAMMAMVISATGLVFIAIALSACLFGELIPGGEVCWGGCENCDMHNKRRRKLDAMISTREALLNGPRTKR